MKIKYKLTLVLLVVSVLLVTTVSYLYYKQVEKEYINEIHAYLKSIAEAKAGRIKNMIIKREEVANLIANNSQIVNGLQTPFKSTQENKIIDEILQRNISIINGFKKIDMLNDDGIVIKSSDKSSLGKDLSKNEGFVQASHGNSMMDGVHYDADGNLSIYLSSPIKLNNTFLGAVLIEVSADEIVNLTSDYSGLGETGETILSKKINDKVVILTPLRFNNTAALNLKFDTTDVAYPMTLAVKGYQGITSGKGYKEETVIACTKYISDSKWGVTVMMDEREAYAHIDKLSKFLIYINLIAALTSGIAALIIGGVIAKPIERLTTTANKIEQGDLSTKVIIDSKDEIGLLGKSFNRMTEKLLENLGTTENLFATVFDAVEKGILLFKPLRNDQGEIYDFEYLLVNTAAEKLLDKKREELIGKKWLAEYPQMKDIGTFDLHVQTIQTGHTNIVEFFFGYHGFNKWFRNKYIKTKNDELLVTFEDITDQKLANHKLEESKKLLEEAEDLASMGNYEINPETKEIIWSESLYRIYGFQPDEIKITLDNFLDYVHPEDKEAMLFLNENKYKKQIGFEFQHRIITKAGAVRMVHGKNRIIEGENGKPGKVIGFVQDITDRVELENRLKQNERFLLESQAIAHVGSFENDLLQNRVTGTEEYYKIVGFSPDERISYLDILNRIHPDDKLRVGRTYLESLEKKSDYNVINRLIMPDQTVKHIWGRAKLVMDEKGKLVKFIGTTTDITRIKKIEEELLESKKELELSNQNLEQRVSKRTQDLQEVNDKLAKIVEQLDKYAYVISHDLRAPLHSIEALTNMLDEEYNDKPLDNEGKDMLNMIRTKIEVMKALIDEVLKTAKEDKKTKEIINLFSLVKEIVETLDPPKNFHVFISHTLPIIFYHKVSMTQILQNLIGNAIKYMDKEHPLIKISSEEFDKYYKICVEDNGQGISERKLPCIFNPFEIAHQNESLESYGIGLSIVKQQVEENGGQIWVESKVGEGSLFHFTVPK